jgi:ribonuclease D
MIETTEQLRKIVQRASSIDAVGLDTEFVWERTYFPRLGLIQLALSKDDCFLIDPLAIKDLSPFGELLANKTVVKIFHDGIQDLAILQRATGAEPCNIFDTRLAAGFAGLSSTLSLLVLVENMLGITLNKTQTRTNWLKRPLSSSQLQYGLDDVRYLRVVRRKLLAQIKPEPGKWLDKELQKFDQSSSYTGLDDSLRYTKIKGANRLNRQSIAILCKLADWREKEARQQNKPRGHIIRDDILLNIARQQQSDLSSLQDIEGISVSSANRYRSDLEKIILKVLSQPEETYPEVFYQKRLNKREEVLLRKLQKWIHKQGEFYGVDPALLGNKAELKGLIQKATAPARQKEGWRKEFLAEYIPD